MAVEWVREKHERRRSSYRDGQLTHTREFQVKCTDPHDGTAVAMFADDGVIRIPPPGSEYRDTRVSSIEADADPKSLVHFNVTVESTSGDSSSTDRDLHPLDRPADVQYGVNEVTEPYFLDETPEQDGGPRPMVNAAGDPFEQTTERERGHSVITVTVNEPFHDPIEAEEAGNTVNLDFFSIDGTTYAPNTLKLSPITATRVVEVWQGQEVIYYRRTYVFKVKKEGWDDKPLNVGLNQLIGDVVNGFKLFPIVDAAGLIVRKPWPLDEFGQAKPNPTDEIEALTRRPYRHRSWNDIFFA